MDKQELLKQVKRRLKMYQRKQNRELTSLKTFNLSFLVNDELDNTKKYFKEVQSFDPFDAKKVIMRKYKNLNPFNIKIEK